MRTNRVNKRSPATPEETDRPKILLVAPRVVASFTRQDKKLLDSSYETTLFSYQGVRSLPKLRRLIRQADVVVIWFIGRHAPAAAWLARRYGVPVISIVGGYEVVWIEDIGYGLRPFSPRARLVRWVLNSSQRVIAVSSVVQRGIEGRVPEVARRTRLIHNAIDTKRFDFDPGVTRSGVLSVGYINATTIKVKGWKLFWDLAAMMPEVQFTAIGPATDRAARDLVAASPPNLTWLGGVFGESLPGHYQSAAVYFQGSRHESFSLAVGEAMSCGCIPVVSRYAMLPTLVGDTGVLIEELNPADAANAIRTALRVEEVGRHAARQRIIENFGVDRRKRLLCAEVSRVIEEHRASRTRPN